MFKNLDKIIFYISLFVILVGLGFGWGYIARHAHIWPDTFVQRVRSGAASYIRKFDEERKRNDESKPMHYRFKTWHKLQNAGIDYPGATGTQGVILHDSTRAWQGLTVVSTEIATALLIDMNGNVIHKWHKPHNEVWPDPDFFLDAADRPVDYWHNIQVFPNGDLIGVYHVEALSPYGGGIVKIDKDSNVLWSADINAHHDFDVAPNGDVWTLDMDYESEGLAIEEWIAVLDGETGEQKDRIRLADVLRSSPFIGIIPDKPRYDYLHTNNLEFLPDSLATEYPWFNPGDVVLSFKSLDAFAVMDYESRELKWFKTGITWGQHDPDWVGGGRFILFDNLGNIRNDGVRTSRMIEYDLNTLETNVLYVDPERFRSQLRGSYQLLPNGNLLITSSNQGKVIEVTPNGKVAWVYVTTSQTENSIGILNSAERFQPDELTFLR